MAVFIDEMHEAVFDGIWTYHPTQEKDLVMENALPFIIVTSILVTTSIFSGLTPSHLLERPAMAGIIAGGLAGLYLPSFGWAPENLFTVVFLIGACCGAAVGFSLPSSVAYVVGLMAGAFGGVLTLTSHIPQSPLHTTTSTLFLILGGCILLEALCYWYQYRRVRSRKHTTL